MTNFSDDFNNSTIKLINEMIITVVKMKDYVFRSLIFILFVLLITVMLENCKKELQISKPRPLVCIEPKNL